MALKNTKADVFGTISASRTLLENYPKLSDINSFISINNSPDQVEFTVDLFKALGTSDDLLNAISDIIINQLDAIEMAVKTILKQLIIENISCNINPSVYNDLVTNGINIEVSSFDIFNILRNSPLGRNGDLYYFDTDFPDSNDLYKSKDFNVFLWYIINVVNPETREWGKRQEVWTNDIVTLTFIEDYDSNEKISNYINLKINSRYVGNENIKLNEFNSDFIDSIKFFDKKALIGELFSRIFGSATFTLSRTKEQIVLESEIDTILDRITQCGGEETEISDDFFSFSNAEYNDMLLKAEKKYSGNFTYSDLPITINSDDISRAFQGFDNDATLVEQRDVFVSGINEIVDKVANNPENGLDEKDKYNFKASLIRNLIKELTSMITMSVMSPKIYLVILLNLKLLGVQIKYANPIDFIKSNLNLVSGVATAIKDEIVGYLVSSILKMASTLALDTSQMMIKSRITMYRNFIKSLFKKKAKEEGGQPLSIANVCKNSVTDISNKVKSLFKGSLPNLPSIPPLLLLNAQFRPGMDSKQIASKIIKRLPEAGAPTGPMSDGSSNVMAGVIAIIVEEIINSIILDSRVDVALPVGSIQIIANGANAGGPVVSSGQNILPSSGVGTIR